MRGSVIKLASLNMDELTGVVNFYPWYAGARVELCRRMAALGGDLWGKEQYSDAAMFVPCREKISDIIRAATKGDYSDKDAAKLLKKFMDAGGRSSSETYKRTVHVPGGDFFSTDQYEEVKRSDDDYFSHLKIGSAGGKREKEWEDPELGFCTETLAGIYSQQGYYTEAKKIYSRLILRYPEKSAYFASLIEKIDLNIKNK